MRSQQWEAKATVLVHDETCKPAGNVTISGSWSNDPARISKCVTDATGKCSVLLPGLSRKQHASVTFTVSGLSHASASYDPSANHDPNGDSNGTSITVVAP